MHDQAKQAYTDLLSTANSLHSKMVAMSQRQEAFSFDLPTWEETKDQTILYTRMSTVHAEIDAVNRLIAAYHILKATYKHITESFSLVQIHNKGEYVRRIDTVFLMLTDLREGLTYYRDSNDRYARQLTAAQFMQTNERYASPRSP